MDNTEAIFSPLAKASGTLGIDNVGDGPALNFGIKLKPGCIPFSKFLDLT